MGNTVCNFLAEEHVNRADQTAASALNLLGEISHFGKYPWGGYAFCHGNPFGKPKVSHKVENAEEISAVYTLNFEFGAQVRVKMRKFDDGQYGFREESVVVRISHDYFCPTQSWMCAPCTHKILIDVPLRVFHDSVARKSWGKRLSLKLGVRQKMVRYEQEHAGVLKTDIALMEQLLEMQNTADRSPKPFGYLVWGKGGRCSTHETRSEAEVKMAEWTEKGKRADLYIIRRRHALETIEAAQLALAHKGVECHKHRLGWAHLGENGIREHRRSRQSWRGAKKPRMDRHM